MKAEQDKLHSKLRERRRWKAESVSELRKKLDLVGVLSVDAIEACLRGMNARKLVRVNYSSGSVAVWVADPRRCMSDRQVA